jgi:hypothetical protein
LCVFHQRSAACGGLGGSDEGGEAEQADLDGQRGRVRDVPSLADRLAGELLHPGERFGSLRGPAPLAFWRGIGDGLQLTQGVRAASSACRGMQVAQVVCEGGASAIAAGAGGNVDDARSRAELATPPWWRAPTAGPTQVEAARAAPNGARSKTNLL